MACQTGRPDAT